MVCGGQAGLIKNLKKGWFLRYSRAGQGRKHVVYNVLRIMSSPKCQLLSLLMHLNEPEIRTVTRNMATLIYLSNKIQQPFQQIAASISVQELQTGLCDMSLVVVCGRFWCLDMRQGAPTWNTVALCLPSSQSWSRTVSAFTCSLRKPNYGVLPLHGSIVRLELDLVLRMHNFVFSSILA